MNNQQDNLSDFYDEITRFDNIEDNKNNNNYEFDYKYDLQWDYNTNTLSDDDGGKYNDDILINLLTRDNRYDSN